MNRFPMKQTMNQQILDMFNIGVSHRYNLIEELDEIINEDFIEHIENDIENGISMYRNNQDNIGVTYINDNNLLGVTSFSIENNDNGLNLNVNNRNINLNLDNNNISLLRIVNNLMYSLNELSELNNNNNNI